MQDLGTEAGHLAGSLPSLYPDARHFRNHLAMSIGPHPAAGSVAEILGTGHGTGHSGAVQDALSAHATVENGALGQSLRRNQEPFEPASGFEPGPEKTKNFHTEQIDGFQYLRMILKESHVSYPCSFNSPDPSPDPPAWP